MKNQQLTMVCLSDLRNAMLFCELLGPLTVSGRNGLNYDFRV